MKTKTLLCCLLTTVFAACGDYQPNEKLVCGPGTHEENYECLPDNTAEDNSPDAGYTSKQDAGYEEAPLACGKGTKEVDSVCVPETPPVEICDNVNADGLLLSDRCNVCQDTTCTRQSTMGGVNPPLSKKETTVMPILYTCKAGSESSPERILQTDGWLVLGNIIPHERLEIKGHIRLEGPQGETVKLGAIQKNRFYDIIMYGNGHYLFSTAPSYFTPDYDMVGTVEEDGSFSFQNLLFTKPWQGEVNFQRFSFSLKLYVRETIFNKDGGWVEDRPVSATELLQLGVKTITLEFMDAKMYSGQTLLTSTFVQSCSPLVVEVE